jgi:hypothetical protein
MVPRVTGPWCEAIAVSTRSVVHEGVLRLRVTATLVCGHETSWLVEAETPLVMAGDAVVCHGCGGRAA